MLRRRVSTWSLHLCIGLSVITANFSELELRNKAKMLPIFLLFASSGEVQSFFHASSGHEPNKPGTGEFFLPPQLHQFLYSKPVEKWIIRFLHGIQRLLQCFVGFVAEILDATGLASKKCRTCHSLAAYIAWI